MMVFTPSLFTAGDLNAQGILTAAVDTVEAMALFRMGGASFRREL